MFVYLCIMYLFKFVSDRTIGVVRWLAEDSHAGFLLAKARFVPLAIVVITHHVAAILRPLMLHPTAIHGKWDGRKKGWHPW